MKDMFVSYHRIRKPDIEIYQQYKHTTPASREHHFVDDRLEKCLGADSIGMKYHHFQSVEGLQNMLYHYNLLT